MAKRAAIKLPHNQIHYDIVQFISLSFLFKIRADDLGESVKFNKTQSIINFTHITQKKRNTSTKKFVSTTTTSTRTHNKTVNHHYQSAAHDISHSANTQQTLLFFLSFSLSFYISLVFSLRFPPTNTCKSMDTIRLSIRVWCMCVYIWRCVYIFAYGFPNACHFRFMRSSQPYTAHTVIPISSNHAARRARSPFCVDLNASQRETKLQENYSFVRSHITNRSCAPLRSQASRWLVHGLLRIRMFVNSSCAMLLSFTYSPAVRQVLYAKGRKSRLQ